ncbi:MAG: 50S ribosomal protein L35 [bacterium]|nr:50S ribosomal protein L35 [bacterium]
MPKLKTHKATVKRYRFSGAKKGKKKIIRRQAGQDHFNARESGKVTMNKRRDVRAHKSTTKTIKTLTPYK